MLGRYLWQWTNFIGLNLFLPGVKFARLLVVWFVPPLAIWLGIYVFKGTESADRIGGGIVQILGVGAVFRGVYQTRKAFGQDGGLSSFVRQLSKWPRWRRDATVSVGAGGLSVVGGRPRTATLKGFPEGASADKRLDLLLLWVNESIHDVDRVRAEVDEARNDLKKDIESERSIRAGEDARVMKTFEGVSTGGLDLTMAAAVWIIFGLFVSILA